MSYWVKCFDCGWTADATDFQEAEIVRSAHVHFGSQIRILSKAIEPETWEDADAARSDDR